MKKAIFILLVLALLAFTACSSAPIEPINQGTETTQPSQEAIPDDIDTSGLDSLEQDIATIDQVW